MGVNDRRDFVPGVVDDRMHLNDFSVSWHKIDVDDVAAEGRCGDLLWAEGP